MPLEGTRDCPFSPNNHRIMDFPLQSNAVGAPQECGDTEKYSGQDILRNFRKNNVQIVSVSAEQDKGEIFIIG